MSIRTLILSLLAGSIVPGLGFAQDGDYDHARDAVEVRAVRIHAAILIDGVPDEPAWAAASPATSFTQIVPLEGDSASQHSDVRILYDDVALYVGAILHDSSPVSSRLGRRDAFIDGSDWFTITLDSRHDHLTSYELAVNPSGVRQDRAGFDSSWDPVWDVATAISDSGWSVEMRIPFGQLRFSRAEIQTWGIQITRQLARLHEVSQLAFTPRSESGGPPRYGHLVGLEGIEPGRRLEALPHVVARAQYLNVPEDDPLRERGDRDFSAGADLKYRLTPEITLDATVNPDFGQVELDPAVVNLTAFETFFAEKRPFFVEGADVFGFGQRPGVISFGGTQLFHSRRIGRQPQGSIPPGARFVDVPDASTILGAVRITGRTSGWSIGFLEAVTEREEARFVGPEGEIARAPVEPLANYLVGRLRRDLRSGQTAIGVIGTSVVRDLEDEALVPLLRSSAWSTGADFFHDWANRSWSLSGSVAASHVRADSSVILAAQRSSARYYQRPDADHLELEPGATSLSGYAAQLSLARTAGLHWRGSATLLATSPGFEVNDLGFQSSADRVTGSGVVNYLETRPGRRLRSWSVSVSGSSVWNYDGNRLGTSLGLNGGVTTLGYWGLSAGVSRRFEGLDDRLTRGGPLAESPGSWSAFASVFSDTRTPLTVTATGSVGRGSEGSRSVFVSMGIRVKAGSRLEMSLFPQWSRFESVAQFVTAVPDPLASPTFGQRYVFADLETGQVQLVTRASYVFMPGLTLEFYAQPFVSAQDFGDFKELRAPRTFDFAVYGVDIGAVEALTPSVVRVDPDGDGPATPFTLTSGDFNVRSLRGNAVLRWEWRPGSTMFLVWQQRRAGLEPFGELKFHRDIGGILDPKPENILVFKVNWWLNP